MQQNDVLCKDLKLVFESWKPLQSSSLSPHRGGLKHVFCSCPFGMIQFSQLSNWIDLPSTSWLYLWIIFQNSQPTGKDSKWTANKKVVGVGQNNFYRFPKHSILDNSTKSAVELNILKWTENLQERFKIDASKLELWKFRRTWIRQAVKDKIEVRSQKSFSRGHGKMLGDVETNCGLKNLTASIWKNYRIIMSSCLFLSLSKVFDILFCLVFFLHEKQHICKRQMDLWWNTHIPM